MTVLAELSGSQDGPEGRDLLGVLEYQFGVFFRDPRVAELLLDVALAFRPPPVDTLRGRFVTLGFDPDTFLISFDRAMRVFAYHLAEDLREEASGSESVVHNLVEMSELQAMREILRDILARQATVGRNVEELWRESRARCAEPWRAVGLSREESLKLAANPLIGAPGPRIRAALSQSAAIVVGEVGTGKSLVLDRLLQRAVIHFARLPGRCVTGVRRGLGGHGAATRYRIGEDLLIGRSQETWRRCFHRPWGPPAGLRATFYVLAHKRS